jgi:alcohol dehydrogenase class IV
MNINFFMPTKVIMTDNCIHKNAFLFKEFGQKALIVTGSNSAKINGALQDITEALSAMEIQYSIFDKVMSNPTIACVYEGAEFAKEQKVEFVIGIGGGSPMDAAKAIALLSVQEVKEEELFSGIYENKALPIIVVPTTAGTGSEVTQNSVLSNDRMQTKMSISTPILYPRLALLDAKYMMNLPLEVTINTALDALSHAIEGMLSVRSTLLSNYFAVESMKRITQCLRYLTPGKTKNFASPLFLDVREKLLYGSMLAGVVIAHTGTTAVHSMGYSLTYFKNIDHGRANALLLPSFLRFTAKSDAETVKKILTAMELNSADEFEALFLSLLGEHEQITEKEIERYTGITLQSKNISNSKVIPSKEDIVSIYSRSLQIV